jgi:hypothetical protein
MEEQSCGFVVGGHDGCFLIIDLLDVDLALWSLTGGERQPVIVE